MKATIRLAVMAGLLWGVTSGSVWAKDVLLAKVTNNNDKLNGRLYIVTDEDDRATGLKLHDLADNSTLTWKVADLANGGAVLKQQGDHKVIVLKSNDFEVDRGGHFVLDMLYNGATGKRTSASLKADFDGTTWKLFHRGSAISKIHFKVKKVFLLGVVGIEKAIFK